MVENDIFQIEMSFSTTSFVNIALRILSATGDTVSNRTFAPTDLNQRREGGRNGERDEEFAVWEVSFEVDSELNVNFEKLTAFRLSMKLIHSVRHKVHVRDPATQRKTCAR